MKSENVLHEWVVTPVGNGTFSKMPCSSSLEKALPGFLCSDLLVKGFSYKPLTLTAGVPASREQYHLLKQLKNARWIRDDLKSVSANDLLAKLEEEKVSVEKGYIGFHTDVAQSITTVRLAGKENLFGIELKKGKLFRFFTKGNPQNVPHRFPRITVEDCVMEVKAVTPISCGDSALGILQQDMVLAENWHISENSLSRFKISFHRQKGVLTLCPGSIIDKKDYFGEGILL